MDKNFNDPFGNDQQQMQQQQVPQQQGFQQGYQQQGFQQGYQQQGFQQGYQQPPFQQQPMYQNIRMNTNRSMIMFWLLSLVTCGIYALVFFAKLGDDMNIIASRRDGKKTMSYWLVAFILSPLTCGIMPIVWMHGLSNRIGDEARARGIATDFGASTFWLWYILGSLLCGIGLFVYMHKLCETMNRVCDDFNRRGM